MKKLLLVVLITVSLVSCKKDKAGCWICEKSGTYNGVNYDGQKETICNDSDTPPEITDAGGNRIGTCNK